jgi:hypothetical protein
MKIDVSILSFGLVLLIAIPVTALRSGTYSIGYEIADLKNQERVLYERNLELKAQLAVAQARVYEDHMQNSPQTRGPATSDARRAAKQELAYPHIGSVTEAAHQP